MRRLFKQVSLLLSILLLLSSLASCGSSGDGGEADATEGESTSAESVAGEEGFVNFDAPEIDEYVDDLAAVYAKRGE
ncbi:MAG: hypothetical protein IJO52_05840, partial [Clostridia bacterium]|nr:hypothetical protein [Clostridia bacterium]